MNLLAVTLSSSHSLARKTFNALSEFWFDPVSTRKHSQIVRFNCFFFTFPTLTSLFWSVYLICLNLVEKWKQKTLEIDKFLEGLTTGGNQTQVCIRMKYLLYFQLTYNFSLLNKNNNESTKKNETKQNNKRTDRY